MTSFETRRLLLSGAALSLGLAAFAPQEAVARCVVAPGSTTCSTVITTDTTNASLPPALDRQYNLATLNSPYAATVESGAFISGFGLAFTNTVGGTNSLNVVNNGTVQIDAGNTATAGGSAALQVLTIGATPLVYSGTGSVLNLGTGGNGLDLTSAGTGGIAATVGGNVTGSNVTSRGILATILGTAGNVNVTTATGTTVRAGFAGVDAGIIDAASAGTITVANNGTILSELGSPSTLAIGVQARTFGTGAVNVTNNGAIGSLTDRVGVGVLAVIDNSASSAALNVQGAGSIFADSAAIAAGTSGTGTVNVTTGAGAINAIGSTAGTGSGIVTQATSGATTINVGAGGIRAGDVGTLSISTTGAQTINVAGQITTEATGFDGVAAFSDSGTIAVNVQAGGGITAVEDAITVSSDGAKTVNIAAGRTVSGAYGVYTLGAGTTTIVNAGTLTGTEAAVFADDLTDGAVTITNQAGATLNGRVDLTDGADTLANAGTFNAGGDVAFQGGTDTLTNQAGGTVNVAAGTTFTGLESFNNAGTVTAASGLTFDAGNTALNNTGTLNITGAINLGAGTDSFSNNGTGVLNLTGNASIVGAETFANGGRINLNNFSLTGAGVAFNNTGFLDTSGNSSLAGFTSFSNSGTLDLAPGTFTVPAAVLTNTGTILADEGASTITGQTSFANSGTIDLQDGATGDVLTINSAFAGSGGSNLQVDVDDATADRLVINGAASGTTRIDAVNSGAGLIDIQGRLVVDATTASGGAFTLGTVTGNTSPLVNFGLRQDGGDVFLTAVPDQSAFDPLALTRFGPSLWYQSADEVISQTRLPADTVGASFWGQVYGSRDRMDDDSTQSIGGVGFNINRNLRTRRHGAQLGVDYGFGAGRVGLTGGYARAKANDGDAGDLGIKANGFNLGAYAQFGGRTGFHGEVFAKHDRYNLDFTSGAFDGVDTDVRANGIDGALGFRFPLGGSATLDANAGVSLVRTKFDDVNAFGFNYDLDTSKSVRGRAGLRAAFGGSFSPYLDATVYREFRGDGRVALFDGASTFDLENEGKATWFRLEGGVMPNPTGLMLAAWADFGDRKALGARLGFRFGGAARVAEPVSEAPAPVVAPPPPPPPPATQTCPDGSVILATDACPVPPPPPPPPPPAPERG